MQRSRFAHVQITVLATAAHAAHTVEAAEASRTSSRRRSGNGERHTPFTIYISTPVDRPRKANWVSAGRPFSPATEDLLSAALANGSGLAPSVRPQSAGRRAR
jgi:hypothetical protein